VEGNFLVIILGLPQSTLPLIVGILLIVVLAYTVLGGMFSVVITDVIQFIFISLGIVLTTIFAVTSAGGFSGMVDVVEAHYGSAGFNLWDAPNYGLLFLIWTGLYYLSGWSSWQPVTQRVFSMRDVATAQKLYKISSVLMFFRAAFPMLWGIAALAILGAAGDSSTALPRMLVTILPAGLIGFVTIGFLSASMSTYDSYLLAFSCIFVQDVVARHYKGVLDEKRRMMFTRVGMLLIAVFIYFWGVYYQFTETVFRYITLTGSLSFAGTLTVLVGGIYWRRATASGAYCAFVGSAIPPVIGLMMPEISSTWFGLASFVLAPAGMIIGSIFLRYSNEQ
jgi:SSS family solute:Na+ symporter